MRSIGVVAATALAAVFFGAGVAAAADPGASAVKREGFLIGFSLGAGDLGPDPCDDCGLGVGGDFHIGAMASRSVAVMLEGSFLNRDDLTHGLFGVAGQFWPDPAGRFWLKAGLGVGSLDRDNSFGDHFDDFDDHGNNHVYPSVFGGAGVEVVRSGRFTLDLQLRGAATFQSGDTAHSVSVNVGANWY
ncbi:MAG TPA: hypothetical protein VFK70_18200 [Vicinamibacteria bacterium]|nr:hypothetical protein [Vicinamibacteria bacterium]